MAPPRTEFSKKLFLAMLVPVLLGLIAWGTLRSDVNHNTLEIRAVETRTTQRAASDRSLLLQRLDRIEDKVDRLIERP